MQHQTSGESPRGDFSPVDVDAMHRALELAHEAARLGEVPVGAVILRNDQVLAEAFNLRETLADATAHAERLAISLAGKSVGSWRLDDCRLYVTLEPCPMCAGAIVLARIPKVFYGVTDPKSGACDSLYRLTHDRRLNHQSIVRGGLLAHECSTLLSEFFQSIRTVRTIASNSGRGA